MDEERVEYVFTGDVSSLKQATQTAIDLLDRYQTEVDRLTSSGNFAPNQKAVTSFASNIDKTVKEVTKLQNKLGSLSDVHIPTGSSEAAQLSSSVSNIESVLKNLSSATKVSTADLRDLTNQLKTAKQGFVDSGSGIDTYVQKELKFQQTLSSITAGVAKIQGIFESVKTRISSLFDPLLAKINSLRNPFAQVTTSVQIFRDKAETALNRVTQMAGAVAAGFKKTQQGSDEASDSASRASSIFEKLTAKFKSASKYIQILGAGFTAATKGAKTFGNRLTEIGKELSNVGNQANNTSGILKKLFTAAFWVSVGKSLGDAAKKAISFIENLNLFTVAMGSSIDKGLEFVDTMSEIYGMDPSNLYRYAGYFYQLTDAIGMADEASATLSLSLTKASNDIASLFNVDIETVVNNLASGIQGMSRAVRKYGMDIRTTTLQQTALNYGITDQVESMSEANRQALRYLTMMEQVQNATKQLVKTTDGATQEIGDFARNIETPANQLRIFKEQISQLARAIGNLFIPVLSKVLPLINGFIMALRTVIEFLTALMGIDVDFGGTSTSVQDQTDALGAMGDAATDAADKIKKLTAPFDELNILSEDTASDAGAVGVGSDFLDPRLAQAIEDMELQLDDVRMKALDVRDALLSFFGFDYVEVFNPDTGEYEKKLQWFADRFRSNLIDKFPEWTKTINAAFDNWSDIVDGFKNVFNSLGNVFSLVGEKLKNFFSQFINDDTVSEFINNLADNLNKLSNWISEHSESLSNFILIIGSLYAGFNIFENLTPVISILGNLFTVLGSLISVAGSVATIVGPIGLVTGAFITLASTSESFRSTIKKVLEDVGRIFESTFTTISNIWNDMLLPTFELFKEAIQTLMDLFNQLWGEVIGPIVEQIGDVIVNVWENTLMPIVSEIMDAITGIIDIILGLWNNVLAPLVSFLITTFGPSFQSIFSTILTIVQTVINNIGETIQGLLTILNGLIDFLAGVFTGDWERAWKGVVNIFIGLVNTIVSVFETAFNFIISIVNMFVSALYNLIYTVINAIINGIKWILNFLGISWDLSFTNNPPEIPPLSIGRIPKLATGGVVTGPTRALIGEGKYDEAVIPLGNSPQMQDLVQQIADAVNDDDNKPQNNPIEVRVFIGDKEWDAFTYQSAQRGEKIVGAQPIKEGK